MATEPLSTPEPAHVLLPLRRQNEPDFEPGRKRAPYRRVSAQDELFISLFVSGGCGDPVAAAREAGFKIGDRPNRARKIQRRLQDLIDQRVLGLERRQQMELDEAMVVVADLARSADDGRVRLGAVRTVLEVHQVLGSKQGGSDRDTRRMLDSLVAAIRQKLSEGGNRARVRVRQAVQVEIEPEPKAPAEPAIEPVDKGPKRLLTP